MRSSTTVMTLAVAGAFAAGLAVSPLLARHLIADAHAEPPSLAPMVIDLAALTHAALPATASPELNAKMLVVTDNATISVQSGNIPKHFHPKTDEIQYIIEGSGSIWLGDQRREFKPGTLIIIPKGTAHAGSIVSNGPVKAIAIKIPPQPKDDTVFVN